jgi:hypothetical protein
VLGDDLVGIYLTGSFALGGGDAASDCDFLVVKDGTLSGDEERALRELHEEIPTWPGYWASNLEGSYAPRGDLETLDTSGRPWLFVDRGTREMEWSTHCNAEDVRWVVFNRPHVLTGCGPARVLQRRPGSGPAGRDAAADREPPRRREELGAVRHHLD